MAKSTAEKVADAAAEEAKPAVKVDTTPSGAGRPNDTPIDEPRPAPLGGNSTLASRKRSRETGEPAENQPKGKTNPNNTTLAERAAARNKRVKADQVASK